MINSASILFILLGLIFFFRWVIVTSEWKHKADKYDALKKDHDDIYVKNLEEILAEEERTRSMRNIKLLFSLGVEFLKMFTKLFSRSNFDIEEYLQKSHQKTVRNKL